MVSEKKSNIKIKVILGYIFVFIAILSSLFIAYGSYNKLLDSVISLSKPDAEMTRMNRVLTNLSEAENKIRIYSLTKKERYLAHYAENILNIQSDLDSLRAYSPDSSKSIFLIDSMNFLLEERADKLERFVWLKRSKEKEKLSEKAMKQLSEVSDATKTKIKTTTTTTTILDTVVRAVEMQKNEQEKKKSFLAKLFSKKEDEKVDSSETVIQRTKVTVDTTYLPQADSLLRSLETMLQTAQAKEQLNREIVSREELRLLEENTIIWDKIKLLLRQLETERLEQLAIDTSLAKRAANDSIFMISVIIIVGFVLGILFIIFILTDITKSNFYRSELVVAKGKAEKLAKVKEDFLAIMSHEIRTPLNAIIGFTNQLNKTQLEEKQKGFVRVLKNSSKHLLGLVNEILDLSKIEAGKLHIENIPFRPHTLIFDVYDVLNVSAENRKFNFNWEYIGDPKINLDSDPFRIKQILLNLGSNAIKFTNEGEVTIKASVIPSDNYSIFEVKVIDTGIGIDESKLETIFEDFSQADSFSARKYGGTGLGLAISRRLARLLGGDLFVESELEKGSCFTLRIPLLESKEETIDSKGVKEIQIPEALKAKRFLVADDDPYSLLLLKTIFGGWGLEADFVEDGLKAFDLVREKNYDLILTDIHMPEMGGIELCRQIRKLTQTQKAEIPIVALTANVRESDLQEYLHSGMTECLVKPFDEAKLIKMLLDLFEHKVDDELLELQLADAVLEESLFDLSQIRQFTTDQELINQILQQFILSANENVALLKDGLQKKDYLGIGEISHKMLSSFNQLRVIDVVPLLTELEELLHKKENANPQFDDISDLIKEVEINTEIVISSIQEEISV
ncbi:ATP-binding protein [Labilibaculum sp. DW002]|uniref:histidine kinase n=1 Tax=Paralabilibaculum antarcticum TaxID=2912572 RepID=A0ABT5VV80_9BACT|nr:ATP-binding protein [Labilibaculum sp. DW002]MDE5419221.1 ATP-binding protein [Labilibaculum sp. DW002]